MGTHAQHIQEKAFERRWLILAVLCVSLLVIVLDNSILNVALPSIQQDLDASSSDLQWMVDSYTLVFAGLLLTAGSLGDRYGRRGALQLGFVLFGIGSVASALATTSNQLIATRAFMGIGGALIMPATLSIITNLFPAEERGKAIGAWAGVAGLGAALGPLTGGLLVEHFYWGSIFLVNIPIVIFGLLAGFFVIPTSKDPHASKLDPLGAVLSILGLSVLLYAIIEAPSEGWGSPETLGLVAAGLVLLVGFVFWERHTDHPMLEVAFFRKPRFTAASISITLTFFSMFGSFFLLTQYFQYVLGYSPLETGVRFLPMAITIMVVSPLSAKVVERIGTKFTVASGLGLVSIGLLSMTGLQTDSSYGSIVWRLVVVAAGMGLTMAPATDSVMGSLPLFKAGVGSAVNDTTRQVGGALGVAVLGSVLASTYGDKVGSFLAGTGADQAVVDATKSTIGAVPQVADQLTSNGLGGAASQLTEVANSAFVDGLHWGVVVAALVTLVGVAVVLVFLPARATAADMSDQQRQYDEEHGERITADSAETGSAPAGGVGSPAVGPFPAVRVVTSEAPATECVALGRPRSPAVDQAIAAATLELLAGHGFEGVTVEAVAALAGVAKSTVYRRYPSRVELILGVIRQELAAPKDPIDTGTIGGDLEVAGRRLVVGLTETRFGRAIPAMMAATTAHPELQDARLEFLADRRAPAVGAVRRAIDRGELRADVDPERVVDLLAGPVFYRIFVKGEEVDDGWIDAHAVSVVRAFAPSDNAR